jgi:hypothetical protein
MTDDFWKGLREARAEARRKYAQSCPECVAKLPKAEPSRLLPGQKCKIHGYRDPRSGPEEARYLTEEKP